MSEGWAAGVFSAKMQNAFVILPTPPANREEMMFACRCVVFLLLFVVASVAKCGNENRHSYGTTPSIQAILPWSDT